MKTLKYAILVVALCFGLTSVANATLTLVGSFQNDNTGVNGPKSQSEANVLAFFQTQTNQPDAFACIPRVDEQENGGTVTSDGFTFVFTPGDTPGGQTVTVTFDLTNSGNVLCGFWVFGGSRGGNLYTVSSDEGTTGTFTIHTPPTGKLGKNFATISHIDVFCCPGGGGHVPDSGTTAMLLGSALTGLGLVRRYLKR